MSDLTPKHGIDTNGHAYTRQVRPEGAASGSLGGVGLKVGAPTSAAEEAQEWGSTHQDVTALLADDGTDGLADRLYQLGYRNAHLDPGEEESHREALQDAVDYATGGTEHLTFDGHEAERQEVASSLAEEMETMALLRVAQGSGDLGTLVDDVVEMDDEGYDFSAGDEGMVGAAQRFVRDLGYRRVAEQDEDDAVAEVGQVMTQTARAVDVGVRLHTLGYRSPDEQIAWADLPQQLAALQDSETSTGMVAVLARSQHEEVREAVAWRSSTSAEVLASMRDDPSAPVRRGVAQSPQANGDLLDHLSKDEDTQVRIAVVSNPNCDSALRGEMQVTDSSDDVRDAAERFQRRGRVRRS